MLIDFNVNVLVNQLTNNNSSINSRDFKLKTIPNEIYEVELDLYYR